MQQEILDQAEALLAQCRKQGLKIATAESCTGGLIAGALTEIAGSSDVFERGFVTYSNEAKHEVLSIPPHMIKTEGAVSQKVAEAMARGAINQSRADIAVAVTGVAGPGGGTAEKPVGLVHIAAISRSGQLRHEACRFDDNGRAAIRLDTISCALKMLADVAAKAKKSA